MLDKLNYVLCVSPDNPNVYQLEQEKGIHCHCPYKTPLLIPKAIQGTQQQVKIEYHRCMSNCAMFEIALITSDRRGAKIKLHCGAKAREIKAQIGRVEKLNG